MHDNKEHLNRFDLLHEKEPEIAEVEETTNTHEASAG
jgi:hypothetical protein